MAPSSLPDLGRRGEGWVLIQIGLLILLAGAGLLGQAWPPGLRPLRQLGGLALLALGLILMTASALALGRQLTPVPRPMENGALRDRGAYALARHPMYGGVVLSALGFALLTSPSALLPAFATLPFFDLKRRREEVWLLERCPEYADYRGRVRRRMIPFLY